MTKRLAGKVAIITGAAPSGEGVGNGMAAAILFAREGAKVVLVNRNAERGEKLARQINDEAATPWCSQVMSARPMRPRQWSSSP